MPFLFEPALPEDIDEIMRIENESFAPEIREERSVFRDRLETFPDGNFVLVRKAAPARKDRDARLPHPTNPRALAGYFSSEIWDAVPPPVAEEWKLGHSARERHKPDGTVLYVSSFAVEPASRGTGSELFAASLREIASHRPAIRTAAFIVHEDWAAARHIYEKAGFSYAGRIDGFFESAPNGKTAAALIMKKEI